MKYLIIPVCALFLCLNCGADAEKDKPQAKWNSSNFQVFYYPWHGNPETDDTYYHWNHQVLDDSGDSFPGGDDIGANFYPEAGCYSNNDPDAVDLHMKQIKDAGIGVLVVSWWGPGSFEDKTVPLLLDTAEKYGLKINFHIEPYHNKDVSVLREGLVYIIDTYGSHSAFFRYGEKDLPLFYIYESTYIKRDDLQELISETGSITIRNTVYDSLMIGLYVMLADEKYYRDMNFDGFYTYFAVDGYTYGATIDNWVSIADYARETEKIFIPCVAPGYNDSRIRPWNAFRAIDRDSGAYYDRGFGTALEAGADFVGITSFNEWHEGTQIEPAVPKTVTSIISGNYTYEDYSPLESDYYLKRTKYWIDAFIDSME